MSLKVVNFSKRYKDKWVLRDVSFDVSAGEIFGICGPCGSGKTTLLAAIAGSISDHAGTVLVDDVEVEREARRDWLCYPLPKNGGSVWKKVLGAAKEITVEDQIRHLSDQMSQAKGVVLLDDPFRRFDATLRTQVRDLITAARGRGLAIILAATEFEYVMSIADRAAILVRTEIKQLGAPQDIYENPESRDVAISTGRCNLFEARRLSSSKTEIPEFQTIEGSHRLFARSVERGLLGAINQNVTLGIRPEHISISFGASFPEDNLLRATITGVQFLGETTLVDLDCEGLTLQSLVLRLVGLNAGDECVLGLPPDRIHIFRS